MTNHIIFPPSFACNITSAVRAGSCDLLLLLLLLLGLTAGTSTLSTSPRTMAGTRQLEARASCSRDLLLLGLLLLWLTTGTRSCNSSYGRCR